MSPLNILLIISLVFFVLSYLGLAHMRLEPPRNDPASYLLAHPGGIRERLLAVCAGDSITHGAVSASYLDLLAARLPDWDFVNAGVNSELAFNLAARIERIIELRPDAVTVLIGTNDVNATFGLRSLLGYYAIHRLPERPNPLFFRENLLLVVRRLKEETKARIALFSIPPIGEDPHHYAYLRTEEYSSIVREIAKLEEVGYLPLRERLVDYLESLPPNRHPTAFRHFGIAQRRSMRSRLILGRSLDEISAANGFRILVDGIHLNTHGAAIAADLAESFFRECERTMDRVNAGEALPTPT
ncbi:MAG TPA: GDSL-type esterase/lipase family protein [Rectinemataceae bacterium]|nr:GDSL-type esterase/lipase family protein [Rectinemataceae bacterium]